MRRGTATLLVALMFLSYTALFAWRANLDLSNHLFLGVVSCAVLFDENQISKQHMGCEAQLAWKMTIHTSFFDWPILTSKIDQSDLVFGL